MNKQPDHTPSGVAFHQMMAQLRQGVTREQYNRPLVLEWRTAYPQVAALWCGAPKKGPTA